VTPLVAAVAASALTASALVEEVAETAVIFVRAAKNLVAAVAEVIAATASVVAVELTITTVATVAAAAATFAVTSAVVTSVAVASLLSCHRWSVYQSFHGCNIGCFKYKFL